MRHVDDGSLIALNCLLFGVQKILLIGQHGQEVAETLVIAIRRQAQGKPILLDCALQRRAACLLGAKGGQGVIDFMKGGQQRFLVLQRRFPFGRLAQIECRRQAAALKDRQTDRRAEIVSASGPAAEILHGQGLQHAVAHQGYLWEEIRYSDADIRGGGMQLCLRLAHIRTALRQFGGHTDRHPWRQRRYRMGRRQQSGQITRRLRQKQSDGIHQAGLLLFQLRQLRRIGQGLRLRIRHIDSGAEAHARFFLRQPGDPLRIVDTLLNRRQGCLRAAQLDVIADKLRHRAERHGAPIFNRCLGAGIRCFHPAAHAAPYVDFPRDVETVLVDIERRNALRIREAAGAAARPRAGPAAAATTTAATADNGDDTFIAQFFAGIGRVAIDLRIKIGGGDAALAAAFRQLGRRRADIEVFQPAPALLIDSAADR